MSDGTKAAADGDQDRPAGGPAADEAAAAGRILDLVLRTWNQDDAYAQTLDLWTAELADMGIFIDGVAVQLPAAEDDSFVNYEAASPLQGTTLQLADGPWVRDAWEGGAPILTLRTESVADRLPPWCQSRLTLPLAGGGSVTVDSTRTDAFGDREIGRLQAFTGLLKLALQHRHDADGLAQAEDQLSLALESALMGIWEWDLPAGTIVRAANIEPVLGLPEGELAHTSAAFVERVHAEDREAFVRALDRTLAMGADYAVEFRILRPDGEVGWVGAQGLVFFDRDGVAGRMIGVLMDIHQRKLLEAQLQQSQKLQAIGTLAGGVAHEVNNQLTIITGEIELLMADMGETGARRSALEIAQQAACRTALITRQLLTFSRREVSQPVLLDVQQVVTQTEVMLRHLLRDDIEFVTTVCREPAWTKADRGHLEQVIVNLTLNARDSMPRGGRLSVTLETVTVDDASTVARLQLAVGPYVRLGLDDTGCGMDPATLGRIFEPFFTTKGLDGTGLGLSTTLGIVRQYGGSIDVRSQPGAGTMVHIYLPRVQSAAPETAASAPDAPPRGDEKILLVEDEAIIRSAFTMALGGLGYTVLSAGDAEQALSLLEEDGQAAVDLLITDVILPGMNGRQLAEKLTSQQEMKVLYMSGYTDMVLGRDGVLPPDTQFLPKPFTADALANKVRDLLDA